MMLSSLLLQSPTSGMAQGTLDHLDALLGDWQFGRQTKMLYAVPVITC